MVLFRHHFRTELGALLGWGGTLTALSLATGSGFALLTRNLADQLDAIWTQLPPQMLEFLGGAGVIATVPGVVNAMVLSGFVPLLITIWTALAVQGMVGADWDRGTLEFLLSLPVRRGRLLAERWLAYLFQLALLYAAIWAGTMLGVGLIGEALSAGRLALGLGLGLLAQAALGGMVLLATLGIRDQTRAVLVAVTLALILFFLPTFVEEGSSIQFLEQLSPVTHGTVAGLLTGAEFPWARALGLLAWAAAGPLLAGVIFTRQEV